MKVWGFRYESVGF